MNVDALMGRFGPRGCPVPKRWTFALLGWMALLLAGCGVGFRGRVSSPPAPTPSSTPRVRAFASPSPTLSPTSTPRSATATPTPPCLAARVLEAELIQLSDIPLVSGAELQVRWVVENTGTCPWEPPLELVPQGDPSFEWQARVKPQDTVPPGGQVKVRLTLIAPQAGGTYHQAWALRTGQGQTVPLVAGAPLALAIPVREITPTPTFAMVVYAQRQVTLRQGDLLELDEGVKEFIYVVNGPNDQTLLHVGDKVLITPLYMWPPDFFACKNAHFTSKNAILNPHRKVGTAYCYITEERRIGALRIDNAYRAKGVWYLTISFITWDFKVPRP